MRVLRDLKRIFGSKGIYRKTKTSELLLIKHIKITKLFEIDSPHHYVQILKFESHTTAQIDENKYTKNNNKSMIMLHHL